MEIKRTETNPQVSGMISSGVPTWMAPPTVIPRLDIIDTGDQFVYLLDVAGADPDKLVLEVSATEVLINGPLGNQLPQGTLLYAERPRGAYTRLLSLPREANADQVTAEVKNGVLVVRFDKKTRLENQS